MVIHYFNLTSNIPPRDNIYLKALEKMGHTVLRFQDNSIGIKKYLNIFSLYKNTKNADIVWVGYTAYLLVPLVKLLTFKPIFFNAFSSLYEGMIISRKVGSTLSYASIKYWIIDFLAFQISSLISVETNSQKEFISNKFFVPKNKLVRMWTGADDDAFFKDNSTHKFEVFTVVFRGAFLPEAGAECAVEAARLLANRDDIKFRIIGGGLLEPKIRDMVDKYKLKNIELIVGKFGMDELRKMMLPCHLSLGQLADHPRLYRTIPHKAFETLAMGLPYLTARTNGILELLNENETCFCFKPGDAQDLAQKIVELKSNTNILTRVADLGYDLYQQELRSDHLAKYLLEQNKKIQK